MMKSSTLILLGLGVHSISHAQCTDIVIQTNHAYVCAPGKIRYSLTNLPPGSSVIWDVGKGPINGLDTLYEFYLHPEKINPIATIRLPDGKQCKLTGPATEILGKPEPLFKVSRPKLCYGPDTVTVTNLTPNTRSISWVIDGTNYFNGGQTQVHQFKTSGTKNVSIVVFDSFGCRGIGEFKDVMVIHPKVTANLKANRYNGCIPQHISINPNMNSLGEKIVSYQWYFEGATQTYSTQEIPDTLVYGKAGTFDTRLHLLTENGCSFEFLKSDWLQFGDTLPINLEFSDTLLCSGDEIHVRPNQNLSGKPDWHIPGAILMKEDSQKVVLRYLKPGKFDIGLNYSYNQCPSRTFRKEIIHVREVRAKYSSPDHFHCKIPHTVHLKSTSYSSESGPVFLIWSYLENGKLLRRSTGKTDSLLFNKASYVDVQLVAIHANGCSDTAVIPRYIRVDSIRPKLRVVPPIACVNQRVKIESITPPSSYLSQDTFQWVLFGRNTDTILHHDFGRFIHYSYKDTGKYDIQLVAANGIGCKDTLLVKDAVEIVQPNLRFDLSDSILCEGEILNTKGLTGPVHAKFRHFWNIHPLNGNADASEVEGENPAFDLKTPGKWSFMYRHQILDGCLDSVQYNDTLFVNGVDFSLKLAKTSACLPFILNPLMDTLYNYHFGTPENQLHYRWFAEPDRGVTIDFPDSSSPEFTFTRNGVYRIGLEVKNLAGCTKTRYSEPIYAGVQAGISAPEQAICLGGTASFIDASKLKPTNVRWEVKSPSQYTASGQDTFRVSPLERGNYTIVQIASKDNQCFDTAHADLEGVQVNGDFIISDTQLYCAPAYAQFQALSHSADTFIWNFGDGTIVKTTDASIANIYRQNSGWYEGFDVTMISKSVLGCSDTAIKNDGIKVIGPVPEFTMTPVKGCHPLVVQFHNKSRDVAKLYMNYNDASPLGTAFAGTHSYFKTIQADSQTFNPSLYAVDSLGCAALFRPTDSIVVFSKPKAEMYKPDTLACVPEWLAFKDLSQKISRREWQLYNSGLASDSIVNLHRQNQGIDTLALVVWNYLSCSDTALTELHSRAAPQVDIQLATAPCFNQPLNLRTIVRGQKEPVRWTWTLPGTVPFSGGSAIVSGRMRPGLNRFQVLVSDSFGCSSTSEKTIVVRRPSEIEEGRITYVSYVDNDNLEIHWEPVRDTFVIGAMLFSDGDTNPIVKQLENAHHSIQLPLTDRYAPSCYSLRHKDRCGDQGPRGSIHCPVTLTARSDKPFIVDLNWTAYKGWKQVDYYRIFRIADGQAPILLDQVPGTILSYCDQDLCNRTYSYLITAHCGQLVSRSNCEAITPLYTKFRDGIHIQRASVVKNREVEVVWSASALPTLNHYKVYVYRAESDSVVREIETTDTFWTDKYAQVQSASYRYLIQAFDRCGEQSPEGRHGTSIHLRAEWKKNRVELKWTTYSRWNEGVSQYIVEIFKDGHFVPVARLDGSSDHYTDADPHLDIRGSFQYRVVAFGRDTALNYSISNEVDVLGPSEIYVPNAFSPNSDDLNDLFRPGMRFMDHMFRQGVGAYQFQIYNRWGEKLFETDELTGGWDGRYMGNAVQEGNYLYRIHVLGKDGVLYDLEGTVALLR